MPAHMTKGQISKLFSSLPNWCHLQKHPVASDSGFACESVSLLLMRHLNVARYLDLPHLLSSVHPKASEVRMRHVGGQSLVYPAMWGEEGFPLGTCSCPYL